MHPQRRFEKNLKEPQPVIMTLYMGVFVRDDLVEFAGQFLARYKLPKTTVLVAEMVRSPSGKPDYRWAKARAMEARGLKS